MFRFIIPFILIGISITLFLGFTKPVYTDIGLIRQESTSYNEALNNSKSLEVERDKLTQKYNSIGKENLDRLEKLLPQTIDNIRLILEIEKLATPYGMALKNVQYDTLDKNPKSDATALQGGVTKNLHQNYGVWNLSFSTEGSYNNFINFVKDIENNLRIVDIADVTFSASTNSLSSEESYKYDFTIKTYWLKN